MITHNKPKKRNLADIRRKWNQWRAEISLETLEPQYNNAEMEIFVAASEAVQRAIRFLKSE